MNFEDLYAIQRMLHKKHGITDEDLITRKTKHNHSFGQLTSPTSSSETVPRASPLGIKLPTLSNQPPKGLDNRPIVTTSDEIQYALAKEFLGKPTNTAMIMSRIFAATQQAAIAAQTHQVRDQPVVFPANPFAQDCGRASKRWAAPAPDHGTTPASGLGL